MKLAASPKPEAETPPPDAPETPVEIARPVDVHGIALTAIAVIAVIMLLQYAQSVIIPIVLGILISYALDPPVDRLSKLRVPRDRKSTRLNSRELGISYVVFC